MKAASFFVFATIFTMPIGAFAAGGLLLKDAIPAAHCNDPEVRLLIAQGHNFSCFTDDDAVTARVCTISGKCEVPKVPEEAGPGTAERWRAFGKQLFERARAVKISAEDFAFTLLPQFIRERGTQVNTFLGTFIPANRAVPEYREAAKEVNVEEMRNKDAEKYETYISRSRLLQGACESGAKVPGVFALFVPLLPKTDCPSWGTTIVGSEKIKKEERNTPLWIKAEPSLVLLGERTTVHWGAGKGMLPHTCAVLGPGLALRSDEGSASTIPITRSASFTFTCVATNGATTTVSTTVDLAL